MNKRLAWLAPIAVAVLLSGCSVTVTMLGPPGPDTLVGYRLVLDNDDTGGPLDRHDASVSEFPVEDRVIYNFRKSGVVLDLDLDVETSNWDYNHRNGALKIVFIYDQRSDLIIDCDLTFDDDHSGTHRCEFERKGSARVVVKETISFGWGEGEFELEKL